MVPADQQMTEPISAAITAELITARREQGTTRDEVAAAARAAGAPAVFTASALRNLETSRRGATVDELVWLAAALETSVRRLLGDHAERFGAEPPPACGALEDTTRQAVDDLGELDGIEQPLAELAYQLAHALDEGAGMATAAVSREYRATMAALFDDHDDEDDDDVGDLGPT